MSDQDRTRKTSNIVKKVDEVEETIPDFYGPQVTPPSESVKKGDLWFRYVPDVTPEKLEAKVFKKPVLSQPLIRKLNKEKK